MKNITIDTDVIVASKISNEENHNESKKFMEYILENSLEEVFFFTSIFTFLELSSAMIRRTKDKDKTYSLLYQIKRSWKNIINPLPLSAYKKSMSPNTFSINWIDDLIETAIKFRSKSGDTIQIQTILENQIDCIITWNKKDFIGLEKQIEGFKVFNPTEVLEEIIKIKNIYIKNTDLINFIVSKSGLSIKEIKNRISTKVTKLSGLISENGAAQIIAAELGIKLK